MKKARIARSRELSREFRFWINVKISDTENCWDWTGPVTTKKRGKFCHKISAREMYLRVFNKDPGAYDVCHRCDNPLCVNPFHLFLGTRKENMQDMINKGRQASVSCEKNPRSKLTPDQVQEIRFRYDNGEQFGKLAKEFKISRTACFYVCKRKNWTDLPNLNPEEFNRLLEKLKSCQK